MLMYVTAVLTGFFLASFLLRWGYPKMPADPMARPLYPLVGGILLGLGHYLMLRIRAYRTGWLVLLLPIAWCLAWIAAGLIDFFLIAVEPGNVTMTLILLTYSGLLYGLFLGLALALVLRGIFAKSWLFILASCAGWGIGMLLGGFTIAFRYQWVDFWIVQSFVEFDPLLYGVASLIAGLCIGLSLTHLFGHEGLPS
jgi:hypothetical protein